ncbi:DHS-like NAD/FAD-binding domain-containing protein [Atractiella rhizophila]|nr:DHS-like NAD/FAD-binding domain-containing protein [Atractiella rhizophila]
MPKIKESSSDMQSFQNALLTAQKVVVLSGAGLSAASGIPTFRGAGGLWRKYRSTDLATEEAFAENPDRVWQFYHYRREKALTCKPNAAHVALAMFSQPSFRSKVAPKCDRFAHITQNVDGLGPRVFRTPSLSTFFPSPNHVVNMPSPQSGCGSDATPVIIEMHGRVHDTRCTKCGTQEQNFDSPICEGLRGTEQFTAEGGLYDEPRVEEKDLPRCKKDNCGGLLRPAVVWFGEMPMDLDVIEKWLQDVDLFLVIGTSAQVWPAAGYAYQVKDDGGKVAVFNVEKMSTRLMEDEEPFDWNFIGGCEELLPKALGLEAEVKEAMTKM